MARSSCPGLAALVLAATTACSHDEGTRLVRVAQQKARPTPVQAPAPSSAPQVNQLMEDMKKQADDAVARTLQRPGTAEQKLAWGAMAIHEVMRPRLGPANAQLFSERQAQLRKLARALQLDEKKADAMLFKTLDAFFDELEQVTAALRAQGLTVTTEETSSGAIGWRPVVPGRAVTVEDRTRTIKTSRPYAELSPGPATVAGHPRKTLWLFPHGRMGTSLSMVTREQPGELEGATAGLLVFSQQAAQSADAVDGKLADTIAHVLYPEPASAAQAEDAPTHGVAHQSGVPTRLRASRRPAGAHVVIFESREGADVELTAWPASEVFVE
ncbi:MAG: hypothetical protein AB2A00_16910 [Myxococcota bacterium]